ncbi:hypothetical protein [Klebsiella michiganensis]|uniref:hypothetical protein n=1 Tax=Klebsiella michiganensis TaxID=1134687 RepID=UPI003F4FD022
MRVSYQLYDICPLEVILVVLTGSDLRFSLLISQLMAKAIPVRGAKFEKPAFEAGFFIFIFSSTSEEF